MTSQCAATVRHAVLPATCCYVTAQDQNKWFVISTYAIKSWPAVGDGDDVGTPGIAASSARVIVPLIITMITTARLAKKKTFSTQNTAGLNDDCCRRGMTKESVRSRTLRKTHQVLSLLLGDESGDDKKKSQVMKAFSSCNVDIYYITESCTDRCSRRTMLNVSTTTKSLLLSLLLRHKTHVTHSCWCGASTSCVSVLVNVRKRSVSLMLLRNPILRVLHRFKTTQVCCIHVTEIRTNSPHGISPAPFNLITPLRNEVK